MARCDNGDSARSEFYAGPREIKALPQAEEEHFARLADGEETGNAALDIPVDELLQSRLVDCSIALEGPDHGRQDAVR